MQHKSHFARNRLSLKCDGLSRDQLSQSGGDPSCQRARLISAFGSIGDKLWAKGKGYFRRRKVPPIKVISVIARRGLKMRGAFLDNDEPDKSIEAAAAERRQDGKERTGIRCGWWAVRWAWTARIRPSASGSWWSWASRPAGFANRWRIARVSAPEPGK